MSDINPPTPPAGHEQAGPAQPPDAPAACRAQFRRGCGPRRGGRAFMVLALIGSFFAGGVLFSHMHAIGDERAMPAWMHHAAWADGPAPHRPDGPPPPPPTPEQQVQHARDVVDRALTSVDATADQKTKIFAIFDAATGQLKGAPLTVFMTRLQVATLLTAPTIDHDKFEALRASRVADIDNASKVVVKAITDAGDVLTQDQRTRLVMMMDQMRHAPPPPPPHG